MRVAICDDELVQTRFLSSLVRKWANQHNGHVVIETFSSANAFLFAWSEDKSFDVLLLDIQMPGQTGMELAKTIRQRDDMIEIIFVTGFSDYMHEGYEVSALHYLIKPVKEDKLFACLDKACKRAKADTRTVLIERGNENLRIHQEEIIYVEAFAHLVVIATVDQRYEANTSIGDLEKKLDDALFFRSHRSYIVGIKYVRRIGKTNITLDNNMQIPVSRRRYNDANRAFIKFHRSES